MCEHPKKGSQLQDGKAHQEAHHVARRDFLKALGLTAGVGMLLHNTPINTLKATPLSAAIRSGESDRILVLIRLKGGNDGLNTIVPLYEYDTYQQQRSTIALDAQNYIPLSAEHAMHGAMTELEGLWNEGQMKVIHGVGYDDQNLSHFRSSDIWASASDANVTDSTGWMGRWLQDEYPDFLQNPPEQPPAIQVGGASNMVFQSDLTHMAMVMNDPVELYNLAQNGSLYDTNALPDCSYGDEIGFLRSIANSTVNYADAIHTAFQASSNQASYPNRLGNELEVVARLIKGQLGTKVYMVSIGGFDTHAEQADVHAELLQNLSEAVKAFFDDLKAANMDKQVLAMTFSEFGRRVEENGSLGTDHGAAAPVLLFGGDLEGGGFAGTAPSLSELDQNGNMEFSTDFRSIYATVLQDWLCVDPGIVDMVMGQQFSRIDQLVYSCEKFSSVEAPASAKNIQLEVRYYQNQQAWLHFNLNQNANVHLRILDVQGKQVYAHTEMFHASGAHKKQLLPKGHAIPNGIYMYQLSIDGHIYGGQFRKLS